MLLTAREWECVVAESFQRGRRFSEWRVCVLESVWTGVEVARLILASLIFTRLIFEGIGLSEDLSRAARDALRRAKRGVDRWESDGT